MTLATLQYADISTAHIAESDDIALHLLAQAAGPSWAAPFRWGDEQFGWYISVEGAVEDDDLAAFSPAFRRLMKQAREADIPYVRFDRDGTEYEDLQRFEW